MACGMQCQKIKTNQLTKEAMTEEGSNNIVVGEGAGANIREGSNNFIFGKNAGLDIIDQDNQVRIGENANADGDEMVILGEGRMVVTKEAFKYLTGWDADKLKV